MFQEIILIGHLGNKPELKYTDKGVAVTEFSLATNKKWTDGNGTQHERTRWFRITCWRKQAEVVCEYLGKGSLVMVKGDDFVANGYKSRDGEIRASMDVQAREIKFLNTNGSSRTEPDFIPPPEYGDESMSN